MNAYESNRMKDLIFVIMVVLPCEKFYFVLFSRGNDDYMLRRQAREGTANTFPRLATGTQYVVLLDSDWSILFCMRVCCYCSILRKVS